MKVAIVGAGISGIATAIRLVHKKHQVVVFESNESPGGKISELSFDGFRFDAGPSLFTMPGLVKELFNLFGEDPDDYFEYIELDEICKYFYEDGTILTSHRSLEKTIQEYSQKTGEPSINIKKAFSRSSFLYKILGELFMFKSLHDVRTFLSKPAFKAYPNLFRIGFNSTMHEANSKIFKDKRLIQLFDRYATYNGSDPYQTPATMSIIPYLEHYKGAYFPKKGIYSITESLVNLARRQGVQFKFGSRVEEIKVISGIVKGVSVSGEFLGFDRVVSNMDITGTYKKLMPTIPAPKKILSQPKSTSAIVFYWGVNQEVENLSLHNIFFALDYKAEFQSLFTLGKVHADPTIYLNISSKMKPDDAPTGCQNWFTMVNAPFNSGQNWDRIIDETRANVKKKLNRMLGVDLNLLIKSERILDPRLIESKTSSTDGVLYGNSSNNKFAAFLRHGNFTKKIKGLYFCGGSVHPGGGIPMVLSSAKIVANYFR